MATVTLTKPHLRDLILDFYSTHDPQRLRIGVDINGMVDWTMSNGIDQLNQMLSQTYGEGIDLEKRLGTSLDLFKRASTALVDMNQIETEENKRNEIYIRLYKFYEAHDKSKLSGIQKIVDYAMYQGVDALNRKLYMKYHHDLGDEWAFQGEVRKPAVNSSSTLPQDYKSYSEPPARVFPQSSGPKPPPQPFTAGGNKNNYQSFGNEVVDEDDQKYDNYYDGNQNEDENRDDQRQGSYAEDEEMDGPPPPRPVTSASMLPPPPVDDVYGGDQKNKGMQAEEDDQDDIDDQFDDGEDEFVPPPPPQEDYIDPKKIKEELRRFYMINDPGKLDVLEAIADWAMRIGRIEFNKKLLQLYDATLDDVPAEVSAPPPAQKQILATKAGSYGFDKSNNNSVPPSPAPSKVSSANSNPSKPLPPVGQPQYAAAPALPKPPVPPSPYMVSNRGISTKSFPAQSNDNFPSPPALNNGFVPTSPATNGFSSIPNAPSFNQTAPPIQNKPKPPKPGMPHPSQLEQVPLPRGSSVTQVSFNISPAPVTQTPFATKGPARVAISAATVGESTAVVKGSNNDGKAEVVNETNIKACDNYRLDMTGTTFGACVCGAGRSAHKAVASKIAKAASSSSSAPVTLPMPVQPAASKPTKTAAPTPLPAPTPAPVSFANNNPGNQMQPFGMPYPPQNFSQQQPMQYQYNSQYPQQGGYPGYYMPQQYPPQTQEQAAYYQAYGYQQMPFQGYPGFNPNMPVQGYQMPPNQAPPPVMGGSKAPVAAANKGGACGNYRLDMTGATFGVCVCGYPRVDHVRKL